MVLLLRLQVTLEKGSDDCNETFMLLTFKAILPTWGVNDGQKISQRLLSRICQMNNCNDARANIEEMEDTVIEYMGGVFKAFFLF